MADALKGKRLLFVDDEPYYTKPYFRQMTAAGGTVDYRESVMQSAELIHKNNGFTGYDALIVDLQMPRAVDMTDADQERFVQLTGLWFLNQFKPMILACPKMGVVILTNVAEEKYSEALRGIEIPSHRIEKYRKIDMPAMQLPSQIAALLSRL
jgi:hypothetical protein